MKEHSRGQGRQGREGKVVGVAITKEGEGFCAVGFVLQLDYISVSISAVTAGSKFATCYHCGKLGKEYVESLSFLTIACESTVMSTYEGGYL